MFDEVRFSSFPYLLFSFLSVVPARNNIIFTRRRFSLGKSCCIFFWYILNVSDVIYIHVDNVDGNLFSILQFGE